MKSNNLKAFILLPVFLSLFIPIFFIPTIYSNKDIKITSGLNNTSIVNNFILDSGYSWPVPGYNKISSGFGPRKAPTSGASSFHSGIDIPAPPGTNLVSISNGKVISVGWAGSAGYSVRIEYSEIIVAYCHMDPNFIVYQNQIVKSRPDYR